MAPAERASFLADLCADIADLVEQIKSLLEADEIASKEDLLNRPALQVEAEHLANEEQISRAISQWNTLTVLDLIAELAEESYNRDLQNALARRGLAKAYAGMGAYWSQFPRELSDNPSNLCREARSWYQKSLDIYQDMKSNGTLSGADSSKPDELAKEIAKCDAALAARRQ